MSRPRWARLPPSSYVHRARNGLFRARRSLRQRSEVAHGRRVTANRKCDRKNPAIKREETIMRRKFKATNVVLALLCAMYFITYIDRVNIGTAASGIQHDLHLSNTQLGLVFSAFAYPYLLCQISGGWIADRFGPRTNLVLGRADLGGGDRAAPASSAASARCSSFACCSGWARVRPSRPRRAPCRTGCRSRSAATRRG